MTKTSFLASIFVLAAAGAAHAGGQPGSLGLGAEYELSGVGGVSLNYDAGKFHAGGLLGFVDPAGPNNTVFMIGGRFYYHVHSTAMSDLGLGANLGFASVPQAMGTARNSDMFLEPGFQIRLFVQSNVAFSFTGGITIGVLDTSGVAITGQGSTGGLTFSPGGIGFSGGAGVHYYFF